MVADSASVMNVAVMVTLLRQMDTVMKGGLKMDKLQEVSDEKKELKRCDNCKHEKEPWTNGCADCFDYELWEAKDDSNK